MTLPDHFFSRYGLAVALLWIALTPAADASSSRKALEAEKARLDQVCEDARQAILSVERAVYVEECVEKEQKPDRASCERFYADYGARTGNRGPLHLDIPECVEAHEFRRDNPR